MPTPVPQSVMILRLSMSTEESGSNLPVRFGFGRVGCELFGRNMPAERDVAFSSLNCAHVLVDCASEFEQ